MFCFFIENICAPIISHCLVSNLLGIVFVAVVCAGSLGMLHTASQYSLYLSSCLTNMPIHILVA